MMFIFMEKIVSQQKTCPWSVNKVKVFTVRFSGINSVSEQNYAYCLPSEKWTLVLLQYYADMT